MMNIKKELIKAIIILPGTVVVFIPVIILFFTGSLNLFFGFKFPEIIVPIISGIISAGIGFYYGFKTVSLFVTVGEGTPAPWAPPKKFVVRGPYRYVRNPMILSVLLLLFAEFCFFGSLPILIWLVSFWIGNTIYFISFEEPALARRFGEDYKEYKKNVRRWIPRIKPWK